MQNLNAASAANWAKALPVYQALMLSGKVWTKEYADDIKEILKAQKAINTKAAQKTPAEILAEFTDAQLAALGVQRIPATPPANPPAPEKPKGK